MTCLKTILAKMTLNKPFINSYLASSISVEAKYYFLIHFINFRNKRPNKNPLKPTKTKQKPTKTQQKPKNPKWQNLNFWVFANPGGNQKILSYFPSNMYSIS